MYIRIEKKTTFFHLDLEGTMYFHIAIEESEELHIHTYNYMYICTHMHKSQITNEYYTENSLTDLNENIHANKIL